MRLVYGLTFAVAAALVVPSALSAQQPQEAARKVAGGGISIPGWQGQVDPQEAKAGMTVDNIVRLTSYLREPAYAEANAAARVAALGGRVVPTTAIVAQTLSPDWLVEIEVIAAA